MLDRLQIREPHTHMKHPEIECERFFFGAYCHHSSAPNRAVGEAERAHVSDSADWQIE